MRGSGARRLALLGVILLGAARAASAEQVHTEFDLHGWRRLGLLAIDSSPLAAGAAADLIDRSNATSIHCQGPEATFSLTFEATQVVRQVSLQPGSLAPFSVSLTVVAEDGRRFAAGEVEVTNGQPAVFMLKDVRTTRLEFTVESPDEDAPITVAELRVIGEVLVDKISMENVPATLPEGGSFPVVVTGRDALGGRPDLTGLAKLMVSPNRACLVEGNRVVTRASGPITVSAHVGTLESERHAVLVQKLQPPPAAPELTPGHNQIRIHLAGTPPFEIFRRSPGEKTGESIGRIDGTHLLDDVAPGSVHQYSARRIDVYGNPLTHSSEESRARALSTPQAGSRELGALPVLVVMYTESLPGASEEADRIQESLEAARLLVFRHTAARLLLDMTFIRRAGPTPSTSGPSMSLIERDLRRQGIAKDYYGLVFVIAGDLDGSWGNFVLLGNTAGAYGRSPGVPTPPDALGPDPAAAWDFIHELQHVLNGRIAGSLGHAALPTGHFDQDYASGRLGGTGLSLDVGEAWDGQAALLRLTDFWPDVGPPYRRLMEVVDSDGDGLPDDDPLLPLDEARFGSSPDSEDSDGDGLGDLAEFMAGLYSGSDPTEPDTDGDGLRDGDDPWPLSDFTGRIREGSAPQLLASGPDPRAPDVHLLACWNEAELTLVVETDQPADVFIDLDGSGALGRWESDVLIETDGVPGSDVYVGPARLSVRAHQPPLGVFVGSRPLTSARVETSEEAGRHRLTVHLPALLGPGAADVHIKGDAVIVPGLRLEAGTILGLGVTVRPSTSENPLDAYASGSGWRSLFETHRLMDATLVGSEDAESTASDTGEG